MITLSQYINESIKHLPEGKTGMVVFDIDDTLIKADSSLIKIRKYVNGDKHNAITIDSDQFAKDPDVVDHKDWFDFSEFKNPAKVVSSIIKGTPILKNLRILDAYVNAGYEFCFLTARGCEDAVKYALQSILKVRDTDGALSAIGHKFNKTLSAAVNDENKKYAGKNDPEKKAIVLTSICDKYDKVVFVDDDRKNVASARSLKLPNLTVIQAWK